MFDDEYSSRVDAINEYIGVDDDEVDDEYCSRVDSINEYGVDDDEVDDEY